MSRLCFFSTRSLPAQLRKLNIQISKAVLASNRSHRFLLEARTPNDCRAGKLRMAWTHFKAQSPFCMIWGFPRIRGTILGVPIIRIIIFLGLYWGPRIYGKLPFNGEFGLRHGRMGASVNRRPQCRHQYTLTLMIRRARLPLKCSQPPL